MQDLSTDVLNWLGVRHIATWVSMSSHKSAALRRAGISIGRQVEIDLARVSLRAKVEIDAKIEAGYYSGPN